jgi:hypothetical protein
MLNIEGHYPWSAAIFILEMNVERDLLQPDAADIL